MNFPGFYLFLPATVFIARPFSSIVSRFDVQKIPYSRIVAHELQCANIRCQSDPDFPPLASEDARQTIQVRIAARIRNAEAGNLGDSQPVGEGVSEMRIHLGPGYRVYYLTTGKAVIFLLMGGDKSTQQADIKRAIAMARQIKESTHDCR